jgi:hypothetical protein
MRLLFILISTFISINVLAQDKHVVVKFSPLSLADVFTFPTVQGGIEFGLSKRVSWQNEFGVKYRKGFNEEADTIFLSSGGFKVKTEVRYYQRDVMGALLNRFEGYYFAVNVFYEWDRHNAAIDYYTPFDSTTIRIDNFGVHKTVWVSNFLLGRQISIGNRFMLDVYLGFGIRFRNISATNKEFVYKQDYLIAPIDLTAPGVKYRAESIGGKSAVCNLPFGFRFCYWL